MSRYRLCLAPASALLAFLLPMSGLADVTASISLSAGAGINLDAGSTPGCEYDITFTNSQGSQIVPFGASGLYAVPGAGGSAEYDSLTLAVLQNQTYQRLTIGIAVNSVFAVKTLAGHYAKVLVAALSSSSVSLQYTTYGATADAPVIFSMVNNYSYSRISPGTLFVISGCGMATPAATVLLQNSTKGLPQTLNGASIAVTVRGVTTHPALYFATANQIAGVLPSSTPTGAGTVTVTYNDNAGSPAPVTIWPTAFGFDTRAAFVTLMAVATDLDYKLIGSTYSAAPGQVITFWGSGLGADPQDSDTAFTATPHSISVPQFPLQVLIGGIPAIILYQGSSGYPGLHQINVQIPQNVSTGCAVPIVAINANYQVISNSVTLPISTSGGMCTDPLMGISTALALAASADVGVLSVTQENGVFAEGLASADFFSLADPVRPYPLGLTIPTVSLGSCVGGPIILYDDLFRGPPPPADAGAMTFNGPGGSRPMTLATSGYQLGLGSQDGLWNPLTGGTYTFSATGGKDVGAFTASLNFPVQESFTIPGTISRSGQTISWTGGSTTHYITISAVDGNGGFICNAPSAAGSFTIPPAVLAPLSGSGSLSIRIATYPQPVSIPGLDAAYTIGYVTPLSSVAVTYN